MSTSARDYDIDVNPRRKRSPSRSRSRSRSQEKDYNRDNKHLHRSHRRNHSRSRSPVNRRRHRKDRTRSISSSPKRTHTQKRSPAPVSHEPILLPSNAPQLSHRDAFKPYFKVFAKYLDIQKHLDVTSLDEKDVKDRFKRFISRWNRGELASGWYGKDIKVQADDDPSLPSYEDYKTAREDQRSKRRHDRTRKDRERDREKGRSRHDDKDERRLVERIENLNDEELDKELKRLDHDGDVDMQMGRDNQDSSDDSDIGPKLPGSSRGGMSKGARAPTSQDLLLRQEQEQEDADNALSSLRHTRKLERKQEKERLEDLVPRADAGTRERQLEKKRENAATNRAFADAKAGGDVEVNEATLMGGGEDSYTARKAALERKKNERELRKEALLLARKEEREERLAVHRDKEEQTMKMLKALADKFR